MLMMADSTISALDMSCISAISLIEFNEQQKANIAAALQAVSDNMMPGNNCCFDQNDCNINMTESIPEEKKPDIDTLIPNFSNVQYFNNEVQLTHDISPFESLVKEEPKSGKCISLFPTTKNEETYIATNMDADAGEKVIFQEINDDNCSDKDDVDNMQDSDYETTSTLDYSKFIDYNCPQCNKDCSTYAEWKSHTDEQHQFNTCAWFKLRTTTNKNGKRFYQCLICMEELDINMQFDQLQTHFINHLPYCEYLKCKICYHKFKQIHNIKDHIRNFHRKTWLKCVKPRSQKIQDMQLIEVFCPICQQLQSDRQSWWKHLKETHNYAEQIRSKIIAEGKDVYCKVCKKKVSHTSIRDHLLRHEKYKSFKCTLCKKESAKFGCALSHKRKIHLQKEQDKPFKCSYCEKSFKNLYLHKKHISDHHGDGMPKCSVCKTAFYSISFLLDHMKLTNHYQITNSELSKV